jgi:hypothetical protein
MDPLLASIMVRGLPLEVWITLPLVVIALYVVFRWRKFGEDSFTWNHSYFKRACTFGIGVWLLSYVSTLPPEPWQRAAVWVAAAIIGVLALDYWGGEGIFPAATIGLFMVLVGATAMPIPKVIGHFIYGDFEPNRREPVFRPNIPADWQLVRGTSSTYRSPRGGAGLFEIRDLPPFAEPPDEAAITERFRELLDGMEPALKPVTTPPLSFTKTKLGLLAFAEYPSKDHGLVAVWLMAGSKPVSATYHDGSNAAAEADIREGREILRTATVR